MNGLLRRPLAVCSALFLILLFVALRSGCAYALLLCIGTLLLCLLSFGAGSFSPKGSRRRRGLFRITGLALAASLAFFSAYRIDRFGEQLKAESFHQTTADAVVTVTEVEELTAYSTTALCRLHTFDGESVEITGRLELPYAATLQAGDRIAFTAALEILSPDGETLADCYDYSQGIFFVAVGSKEEYQLLAHTDRLPDGALSSLKTAVRRQLYPYLTVDDTGLVSALLLGDRSGLSPALSRQFRNLGISHTLAVSGLHLSILCGTLLLLFNRLHLPRRWRLPLLLPLLLLYMLLVGSPSVYRAGGMLLLLLLSYHFGRRQDPITALLATVSLICLLSPQAVLDIGLLLSFFATFGILLVALPLTRKSESLPRPIRYLLNALTVTAAATLFTLPFSVWYFGEWALLSPIANLLLVPLITALLYLIPLLLLLSPIPWLAATPAYLIRLLIAVLRLAGESLGASDHLLLPLGYAFIRWTALLLLPCVISLLFFRKTRPWSLAAMVLFLSLSGAYCSLHSYRLTQSSAVEAYAAEDDECILIRAGTRTVLIDRSEAGYAFLADAVQYGERDPLVRVDTLLLTSYHYRQISSLTRLLENRHLEYLILPSPSPEDRNIARTLEERAVRAGCRVQWYSEKDCCIGYHDAEIVIAPTESGIPKITVRTAEQVFFFSDGSPKDPL